MAALKNLIDIVKILITAGADVNIKNSFGYTPLHSAVLFDALDVVKILITAGAKTTIVDDFKKTPFDYARSNEMRELFRPKSFKFIEQCLIL